MASTGYNAFDETTFEKSLYIVMRFIKRTTLVRELDLRIETFTSIDVEP